MNKIISILSIIVYSQMAFGNNIQVNILNQNEYEKNLLIASEFYLSDKVIPENILLNLVPENISEFIIYYGTTGPENILYETNFFYDTSILIFEQVIDEKNEMFYLPSLKLASFADGEFFELFDYYLKEIIKLDKEKFCDSVKGKKYTESNPIKFYYLENDCGN